MNEWDELRKREQVSIKISFEKKIPDTTIIGVMHVASFKVTREENHYYMEIRNGQFAGTSSHIKLTKEEFNQIAKEMHKLWEPSNIIEALDKNKV